MLGRVKDPKLRRRLIIPSLAANLGFLFYFKYYDFAARTINQCYGSALLSPIPFLLPAGISFYTFQTLSYTLDVYWNEQEPERHFGRFATFVSFFPHLVAGPIMRAGALIPQLRDFPPFEYQRVTDGLKLAGWGLFKKVVIADRLARLVDPIYGDVAGALRNGSPAGDRGIRLSNLLRFFGLYRHCPGRQPGAGSEPGPEFSGSVSLAQPPRVLDPLAHLAFDLVSRLRLYSARRQPRLSAAVELQHSRSCSG